MKEFHLVDDRFSSDGRSINAEPKPRSGDISLAQRVSAGYEDTHATLEPRSGDTGLSRD